VLNIHHYEDWGWSVSSEDIVDKNILCLELGTSCVPSNKLLLCVNLQYYATYLFEHIGHCFMVQVIQIPNVRLVWILLINHGIAVSDLDYRIDLFTYQSMNLYTQQSPDNSLVSTGQIDSIEMIHY
jgi:hypothetical protein